MKKMSYILIVLKNKELTIIEQMLRPFVKHVQTLKIKKKIIILDDIDLINEQSQQVFRNCIDKYSHNVHFISSCSNIQKVIESLQSRFTIIKIKPLKRENLISIIENIKQVENIDIDEDAQNFIINVSNNTVKILINYMEKFKLLKQKITYNLAVQLCSNISFLIFEEYTKFLLQKDLKKAIYLITELYDKGYSVMDILDNYFIFVKSSKILNEEQKFKIIPCICKYITIFHNIHEDEIELSLFTNNIIEILRN